MPTWDETMYNDPHLSILRENGCRSEHRIHRTTGHTCDLWNIRTWSVPAYKWSDLDKCRGWIWSSLTCYALKYSVAHNIQWPRPLKSNTKRRNVAKKMNFSEVEIDTVIPEIELKKDVLLGSLKTGIKGVNKNIKTLSGRRSRRQLKSAAMLRCYATKTSCSHGRASDRQTEICRLLASVVTSLEPINNTLKEINDNLTKSWIKCLND